MMRPWGCLVEAVDLLEGGDGSGDKPDEYPS